jgi:ribose 1,5-bisphosphokinase PhnN
VLGTSGRVESQRLGVAVFGLIELLMREFLANGCSLIVEGNFNRAALFDGLPEARITQVHVSAAPDVLRSRMLERDPDRHPVHWDREAADEVAERTRRSEWEPLSLPGELIRIDTTVWPDLADALAALAR